jgi:poly(A) polymerase
VATSARPDEVEALFERTVPVGKAFGVILVLSRGAETEVATFRGDGAYVDGRRPENVVFSSAAEDARRRDFTINAMMYDPLEGRLLDVVGGEEDLRQGILRTVGNPRARFREDHLRLLRAVRFAARTGFEVETETAAAIRELAALATKVSCERIGEELRRMLCEGSARRAFKLMDELALLPVVLPEVAAMRGIPQPAEFHPEGDVWTHTLLMLELMDETMALSLAAPADAGYLLERRDQPPRLCFAKPVDREVLGWGTLLHDVGKPMTISFEDRIRFNRHDAVGARAAAEILGRMRRPNRVTDRVASLVAVHMTMASVPRMRTSRRRRFLQRPDFPLCLELHRLDCVGSHGDLDLYEQLLAAWLEERARPVPPTPLLSGRDLRAAGYASGPQMGALLRAVADARLEGEISTSEEALAWLKARWEPDEPEPRPG